MRKSENKSWDEEHRDVLVGIRTSATSVVRILVQKSGAMSGPDRIHHPRGNRTAEDEAAEVFGLSKVRRFAISNAAAANDYAAELRRELAPRTRKGDAA